jgi:chemotaxis signal transduction protein
MSGQPPADHSPLVAPAAGGGVVPQDAAQPVAIVRQGVRIGELRLLFDFAATSQLSALVPITPIPATPPWLAGLVSLRGNVLPVVDLATLVHISHAASRKQMLLVIGHGESAAAVLIDGLPERLRFVESDLAVDQLAESPEWLSGCVSAALLNKEERWLEIDHTRFLDKLEATLQASPA